MREGLLAWNKLPDGERKPRAVSGVPRVNGYSKPPDPPPGGLILKSHVRALQRDEVGDLSWTGPIGVANGAFSLPPEPQLDHAWFTEAEWRSLIPANPTIGSILRVLPPLAERIARFHLLDKALGCSDFLWEKARGDLGLTVTAVSPTTIKLELNGMAYVGRDGRLPVRLQGRLEINRSRNQITRWDMIAIGRDQSDVRTPAEKTAPNTYWYRLSPRNHVVMAIAFELVDGSRAIDRVPPYAVMFDSARTYDMPYLPKD